MRLLHLGCGRKGYATIEGYEVLTLDADSRVEPDLVCCLGRNPIPLPEDSVDMAIAVHVLEHIGKQGDTVEWFQFWEELYRVLKPEGKFEFLSPIWSGVWAWADPTHVRALSPESFYFFQQDNYRIKGSPISPYRIRCDFIPESCTMIRTREDGPIEHFSGVLVAKKPLKPWWYDAVTV